MIVDDSEGEEALWRLIAFCVKRRCQQQAYHQTQAQLYVMSNQPSYSTPGPVAAFEFLGAYHHKAINHG